MDSVISFHPTIWNDDELVDSINIKEVTNMIIIPKNVGLYLLEMNDLMYIKDCVVNTIKFYERKNLTDEKIKEINFKIQKKLNGDK